MLGSDSEKSPAKQKVLLNLIKYLQHLTKPSVSQLWPFHHVNHMLEGLSGRKALPVAHRR